MVVKNTGVLTAVVALVVACFGCAPHAKLAKLDPKSAEYKYEAAMLDLEDGLFPEAIKGFSEVKTKHPYTEFARLADLRISDVYFEQGKYEDAIGSYRRFLKYNPDHGEVAYALYQIGECYFERLPQDWWFLPPAAEKDQVKVRQAIGAYRDLMAQQPTHDYAKQGAKRVNECRARLAQHELYVAEFYFKRGRYKASAKRAEGILADYAGLGLDAQALWITGKSHFETGEKERASLALDRLIKEFPGSNNVNPAGNILQKLEHAQSAAEPEAPKEEAEPALAQ